MAMNLSKRLWTVFRDKDDFKVVLESLYFLNPSPFHPSQRKKLYEILQLLNYLLSIDFYTTDQLQGLILKHVNFPKILKWAMNVGVIDYLEKESRQAAFMCEGPTDD